MGAEAGGAAEQAPSGSQQSQHPVHAVSARDEALLRSAPEASLRTVVSRMQLLLCLPSSPVLQQGLVSSLHQAGTAADGVCSWWLPAQSWGTEERASGKSLEEEP